jgi:hypothetical protein
LTHGCPASRVRTAAEVESIRASDLGHKASRHLCM